MKKLFLNEIEQEILIEALEMVQNLSVFNQEDSESLNAILNNIKKL